MGDGFAIAADALAAGQQGAAVAHLGPALADVGFAAGAVAAGAAACDEDEYDMVAGLEIGDAATDLGDDAGTLVAEHGRQRTGSAVVDGRQIGVA